MRWLARFADRTHPLVLPGAWVLVSLAYFYLVYSLGGSDSCCWTSRAHLWGSILNYCLITGYLLAAVVYQHRGHRDAVRQVKDFVDDPAAVNEALADPGWRVIALMVTVVGLYGLVQYAGVLLGEVPRVNPWLDLSLAAGNEIMWLTIGLYGACRLSDALALRKLGIRVRIDLYDMTRLKPFGQAAIRDVLVIMGALALMPLQALDAQFRLINYQDGLVIGLTMAAVLFVLSQAGVRAAIRHSKSARIRELQESIDAADKGAVTTLEALVAHRDRIQHLSTWPLDLSLVSRVAFYLVIPPLAWVGAALVETLVQGFLD